MLRKMGRSVKEKVRAGSAMGRSMQQPQSQELFPTREPNAQALIRQAPFETPKPFAPLKVSFIRVSQGRLFARPTKQRRRGPSRLAGRKSDWGLTDSIMPDRQERSLGRDDHEGAVKRRVRPILILVIALMVPWPGPPPSRARWTLFAQTDVGNFGKRVESLSGELLSKGALQGVEICSEHVKLLTLASQERDRFLEMAFSNPDFVKMMGVLQRGGFIAFTNATNAVQVWLLGEYMRTVLYVPHQAKDGTLAHAVFGIEKDGMHWTGGVLSQKGDIKLLTVRGGIVQPLRDNLSEALLEQCDCRRSCNVICGILCGGLCGLGCGLACLLICGVVNVCCGIICGTICGAACGGGCALGCDYICSRVC